MQTILHPTLASSPAAQEGASIIGRCVHCGFCLANCPTYQLLGDERDSPRGRIYLIKAMLEGATASATTQTHLDRCLGCRACESACPSGVRYGALLDIGRGLLEAQRPRRLRQRWLRTVLLRVVPSRARFDAMLRIGRRLRGVLPRLWRAKIPARAQTISADLAGQSHARRVLALDVCAESATPATRASLARVLARCGLTIESAPGAGCCGALAYHLGRHAEGLAAMRRNIDAWGPLVERGAEAIVVSATGCGVTVRDYGHLLRDDAANAERAARIAALVRDPAELVDAGPHGWLAAIGRGRRIAFHAPCSLQHGLKGDARVERLLREAGYELAPVADAHLCCGSAGSYSILQAAIADALRARKLAALVANAPDMIATANIGCQLHLGAAANVPVRHWIELIDPDAPPI